MVVCTPPDSTIRYFRSLGTLSSADHTINTAWNSPGCDCRPRLITAARLDMSAGLGYRRGSGSQWPVTNAMCDKRQRWAKPATSTTGWRKWHERRAVRRARVRRAASSSSKWQSTPCTRRLAWQIGVVASTTRTPSASLLRIAPVSISMRESSAGKRKNNKSVFSFLVHRCKHDTARICCWPPCYCGYGSKGGRICCRRAVQQSIDVTCLRGPQQQTRRTPQLRHKKCKKCKSVKIWQNYGHGSVASLFGPPCI